MERITDKDFFTRPAEEVAKLLLGKILCRRLLNGAIIKMRIMEVEAYPANDSACYGYKKDTEKINLTPAIKPLVEKPGTCCIYSGMILISCSKEKHPDNVLIRKVGRKGIICDGPWLTGKIFEVDSELSYQDLLSKCSNIWIEDDNSKRENCSAMRVNLSKSVKEVDRKKKLRFISI